MLSSFHHQAKQEAIEELSRDPDSNVTAADAQKTLVEESRKAGATALHFDPNASPAEKARQAGAGQKDTGIHHRPRGVGIVTDQAEGPDEYDLPPPTKAGVIVKAPANGDVQTGAVDGAPPDEEFNWLKIGGWAPQFGTGDTESIQEENTLLDHQTLLEAKLDEKFFGDWYHNAGVIAFACISSWMVALIGGGIGWLFIIMAACGTYYRTSIRRVRRNFRDDISREHAKARLETDTESLEWMNSFLVKFWPIYAPQLAKSIVQSVDQVLSTSTPAFLESMRMETFILGTKPPRMEHVKTYPRMEEDIVMMDWKFSFTPTDTLDMTARQLKHKINPKVVLEIRIGKAMVSKAMKIIVEDFAFSGLMRIKMKLQLEFPHIERVDICFLGRPEIDYVCKPLGGETFGFDINFIPGLEGFIKEQIHANLQPIMYDPNVFPIEVAKMLSGNPIDLAIGVVAITLYGATGLKNSDKFSGTPDPYASISINNRDVLAKTKTIHENSNPRWNETLYIIVTNFTDTLTMNVFDYNEIRKDKDLGTASFALEKLEHVNEHEGNHIEILANGKPRGILNCDIRFFPVLEGQKGADGVIMPPPESNTGIARITVEQAKDLDGTKSMIGSLNPYGVLLVNGKEVHITTKLKRTNNPIFPNPSISVLVTDRKKARIGLVIKDDRDLAQDPVMGSYQIKLDDLLDLTRKGQEWFNLAGTKTGRAKLMVDWRPVALTGVSGGSGGYITPIGVMRVHFKGAEELRNFETLGKSDPYGRVQLSGVLKGRTVTFRNNLNPKWDEVIYVPVHSANERLTIEVMDEEKLGKDRSLGLVEVPVGPYLNENEEGLYIASARKDFSDGLRLNGQGQPKGRLDYSITFFPLNDVIDPEDEEEAKAVEAETKAGMPPTPTTPTFVNGTSASNASLDVARPGIEGRKSLDTVGKLGQASKASLAAPSINGSVLSKKERPKLRIGVEDLGKYECGLVVFHIIEGNFAHSDVYVEIIVDEQAYPSFTSAKVRSRHHTFGEISDAFIRELEFSHLTVRLVEKTSKSGDEFEEKNILAKLSGPTMTVLQQCLYTPTKLTLKGTDGSVNDITVKLRYLPVEMHLDPSESISNSGTLRVEIMDADDLPAADRSGYSDPYCKFKLNGKEVHKTKVQKKTLHPAWNEFFEVQVPSRTGADFRCDIYDWDFGDKADFLGSTPLNLSVLEPMQQQELTYTLDGKSGVVRMKMLFKPAYVARARQGSSTISGTFAPAGKIVGAPVKGVSKVGGGVVKGASFLKRGFTGRGSSKDEAMPVSPKEELPIPTITTTSDSVSRRSTNIAADGATAATPVAPVTPPPSSWNNRHNRSGSNVGTPASGAAEQGTAQFVVIAANGYPPSADVRVHVKMMGPKGGKDLFKTKAIKSSTGSVSYDQSHETFKVTCPADTQFQVVVKDHGTFASKDLGEGLFFVADQGAGTEQSITAGAGTVTLRSSFTPAPIKEEYAESLRPGTSSGRASPESKRGEARRSIFGRRHEDK